MKTKRANFTTMFIVQNYNGLESVEDIQDALIKRRLVKLSETQNYRKKKGKGSSPENLEEKKRGVEEGRRE